MDREALEGLTRKALVERAKELGLTGYSARSKVELVDALLAAEKPAKAGKKSKVVPATAVEKTVPAARRDGAATEVAVAKAKKAAGEASPGGGRQDAGAPGPKVADKPQRAAEEMASKAKPVKAEAAAKKPVSKENPGSAAVPAAPKGKAKAEKVARPAKDKKAEPAAAKEPRFKPAEAFLDSQDAAGDQPAVPAGQPQFKKTSKVDDLLAVDTALGELPPSYDENRAVLLVRDPQWAYAYWDLSRTLAESARGDYRQILRVQELSGAAGRPAYFFDVQVPRHARSWYLKLPGDGRRYRVEVGLHYRDGSFVSAARSNEIEMPRAKPSEVVADRFVTLPLPEEEAAPAAPPQQQ
ncbi:MAG: DUF4912 domain-containing protein, partial [Candidatus Sericytochromatia bacterium]|nr:DUF4912 domain-containing protein [Candidatus Tanganyikabacteria bacterium]